MRRWRLNKDRGAGFRVFVRKHSLFPFKEKKMKKIVTLCTVLALAFAMSIMFTACDNGGGGGGGGGGGDDPGPIKAGLYAKTGVTGKDKPIDIPGATPEQMVAITFFYMQGHPGTYTLVLEADNNVDPQELNDNLTLMGIGGVRNINLNYAGSLILVKSNAKLTLDENITLRGMADNSSALVKVEEGGTLIMKSGSMITGNTNDSDGGGVYVNRGTFTMYGGVIVGNNAQHGAGVYVFDGTFNMYGGEIKGNNASLCGGGVYLSYHPDEAFIHMAGGTIYGKEDIAGDNRNTAEGYHDEYGGHDIPPGAALYLDKDGYKVEYGTLSGNTFTRKGSLPVEFNDSWLGGAIETTIKVVNGALVP